MPDLYDVMLIMKLLIVLILLSTSPLDVTSRVVSISTSNWFHSYSLLAAGPNPTVF